MLPTNAPCTLREGSDGLGYELHEYHWLVWGGKKCHPGAQSTWFDCRKPMERKRREMEIWRHALEWHSDQEQGQLTKGYWTSHYYLESPSARGGRRNDLGGRIGEQGCAAGFHPVTSFYIPRDFQRNPQVGETPGSTSSCRRLALRDWKHRSHRARLDGSTIRCPLYLPFEARRPGLACYEMANSTRRQSFSPPRRIPPCIFSHGSSPTVSTKMCAASNICPGITTHEQSVASRSDAWSDCTFRP